MVFFSFSWSCSRIKKEKNYNSKKEDLEEEDQRQDERKFNIAVRPFTTSPTKIGGLTELSFIWLVHGWRPPRNDVMSPTIKLRTNQTMFSHELFPFLLVAEHIHDELELNHQTRKLVPAHRFFLANIISWCLGIRQEQSFLCELGQRLFFYLMVGQGVTLTKKRKKNKMKLMKDEEEEQHQLHYLGFSVGQLLTKRSKIYILSKKYFQ